MPDLTAIVQKMIDAGESEENIATVIQAQKTSPVVGAHPEARISAARGGAFWPAMPPTPDPNRRADSNMATIGGVGVPPEAVLMGPVQAGRAMLRPGLSLVGRAAAGAGSVIGSVTPVVKYEVAKHALTAIGLPESVASVAAMGISGYKKGGGVAVAKTAAETVAKDAPAVAETAAVAAAPAAVLPFKPPPFNPSKAMTQAREAFATVGEQPLAGEASNTMELIRRGKAPEEAIAIVLRNRPATVTKAIEQVAPNVKLTADEVKIGMEMVSRGKTPTEAFDAIKAQREFLQKFSGAQTDTQVKAAIDLRNTRGQIKTPSAQTAEGRKIR